MPFEPGNEPEPNTSEQPGGEAPLTLDSIMDLSRERAAVRNEKNSGAESATETKPGAESAAELAAGAGSGDGVQGEAPSGSVPAILRVGKLTFKVGEEVPPAVAADITRLETERRTQQSRADALQFRLDRMKEGNPAPVEGQPADTPTPAVAKPAGPDPLAKVLADAKALDDSFGTDGQFSTLMASLIDGIKATQPTAQAAAAVPEEYAEGLQMAQSQATIRREYEAVGSAIQAAGLTYTPAQQAEVLDAVYARLQDLESKGQITSTIRGGLHIFNPKDFALAVSDEMLNTVLATTRAAERTTKKSTPANRTTVHTGLPNASARPGAGSPAEIQRPDFGRQDRDREFARIRRG